jgi:uncharacterized protein YdaU (DUF1376 family)
MTAPNPRAVAGGNGGPALDDAEPPRKMHIVRIHINDWVASTRGMTVEEEGFYFRFTMRCYDRMGPLIDDDQINSRAMEMDIRAYRRLKARMIALGKIRLEAGRLSHPRILREIDQYLTEYKNRSRSASKREEDKRVADAIRATSGGLRADFGEKSAGSPGEVGKKSGGLRPELTGDCSEKANEINACAATTVTTTGPQPSRARAFPKPKPKSNTPYSPPPGDSHREELDLGSRPEEPPKRKRSRKDALAAVDLYNQAAEHFDFSVCKHPTEARLNRLEKRLADIGGLENFKAALLSLKTSSRFTDFLLGRLPARDGSERFKLDIDRLLQTDGKHLGDVLARLLDMAEATPEKTGPNGRPWDWWRQQEQALRSASAGYWRELVAKHPPNGEWPWWFYGPPPGDPECLMHPDVLAEYGFDKQYNANGAKKHD